MNLKIAITGGTGFIGRPLVESLAACGHRVLLLTTRPANRPEWLPASVDTAHFDLYQPAAPGLLRGQQAVIHLASEPVGKRWTPEYKERLRLSRRLGTSTIAAAAVESGTVRTFINASGIGFYGTHAQHTLDEGAPRGQGFVADACQEREDAAHSAQAAGIRTVHVRIGLVLHPSGGTLQKLLKLTRFGMSGQLGNGRQQMSWIHRADLVALLSFAAIDSTFAGVLNGTAPHPVSNAELSAAMLQALGRRRGVSLPGWLLRATAGEMSSVLLDGQRVVPRQALALGFRFSFETVEKALEDLVGSARRERKALLRAGSDKGPPGGLGARR